MADQVKGKLSADGQVKGKLAADDHIDGSLTSSSQINSSLTSNGSVSGSLSSDGVLSGALSVEPSVEGSLSDESGMSAELEIKRTRTVATMLSELGDVDLDDVQDGDVLTYDSDENKWVNGEGSHGGGTWGTITGTLSDQTDLQDALDAKIDATEKGANNGVATLGSDGKVPSSQLPASDDDIFVARYGVTTYAEIDAAYTAGKYILVTRDYGGTTFYGLTNKRIQSGQGLYSFHSLGQGTGTDYEVYVMESGTWGHNYEELAPISSPTFTGYPKAPTASAGTNNTQIATTAFVHGETSDLQDQIGDLTDLQTQDKSDLVNAINEVAQGGGGGEWGSITGDIDDQTDLQGELAKKVITLTKAQYDALSTEEKEDLSKVYYVTDYGPLVVAELNDTVSEVGKVWSSSKISTELGKKYDVDDTAETDLQDDDYFPFYDKSITAKRKTLWSNIKAKLQAFFSNLFVAKSGDTMTGTLQRDIAGGSSTTYIEGCGGASGLHINKAEGDIYYTAVSMRTKTGGGWAVGNYNNDNLQFSFGTKADIESNTNNVQIVNLRPTAGTLALTSEIPSTYAGSDSAGGKATSAVTADVATHVKYQAGNEINFKGGAQTTCWFNYRNADTGSSAAVNSMLYKFANYSNDTSKTTIDAANFTGKAAYAGAVKDSGNNTSNTTFAYSKAGLGYGDYTWLAGWNGYELRAVAKTQFQKDLSVTLIYNGKLSGGAWYNVDSSSSAPHYIYIIAYGTWNASQLIAVFPNNSSTPVCRLIAGFVTSFTYIQITARGQWGFTVKNTNSSVTMPLVIWALPKWT